MLSPLKQAKDRLHLNVSSHKGHPYARLTQFKDDPEAMHNMPCSLQVFTSGMRDEECLQAATLIDQCVNGTR
jgi:hypothetical protein